MNIMKLNGSFDAIDPFLDAVAHWQQDYIKLDDSPFSAEFEQYVSSDFHIGRVRLSGHVLQTGAPIAGAVSLALFDDDLPGTLVFSSGSLSNPYPDMRNGFFIISTTTEVPSIGKQASFHL